MAQDLEELAATIWDKVCHNVDLVLKECELHGLAGILTIPDPSIESRIAALRSFDSVCTLIISTLESDPKQYSTTRRMFNAKQQILNLEILLNAARNKDEASFKETQDRLNGQATH